MHLCRFGVDRTTTRDFLRANEPLVMSVTRGINIPAQASSSLAAASLERCESEIRDLQLEARTMSIRRGYGSAMNDTISQTSSRRPCPSQLKLRPPIVAGSRRARIGGTICLLRNARKKSRSFDSPRGCTQLRIAKSGCRTWQPAMAATALNQYHIFEARSIKRERERAKKFTNHPGAL